MNLRILIVDDTVTYRKLLSDIIAALPNVSHVATAPNGLLALKKIELDEYHLVFLDIHMPELNGLETLKKIREKFPHIAVVMISGISSRSTTDTVQALQIGALDFIRKPDGPNAQENLNTLEIELRNIIRMIELRFNTSTLQKNLQTKSTIVSNHLKTSPDIIKKQFRGKPSVCVIGVSTGGPEALGKLIPLLGKDFPLPILMVQHMPPYFTKSLAESLDKKSQLRVIEAVHDTEIEKGFVYIAPGGKHMVLREKNGTPFIAINEEPAENSCRPSVDVLFRSAASVYGDKGVLAVIMTGMGNDGLSGTRALKRKNCICITQDENSCVVYGMPRAIDEAGLTDKSVPLEKLAETIEFFARKL